MKMLRWGRQIAHVQTVTARNRMEEKKRKEGGGEEKDPLRVGMYSNFKAGRGNFYSYLRDILHLPHVICTRCHVGYGRKC